MKHSVILLIASLTFVGCGETKSDESSSQTPPPVQEQPAQQPAAEPAAQAPTPKEPTSKEPISRAEPKQEPTPKAPTPKAPTPKEPTPKEEPKTKEPKPKEEPKPQEQPKPKEEPPPQPAPQKPAPPQTKKLPAKDVVVMTASKLGAVTLQHKLHAEREGNTCTSCHHPSKPEKPMTAAQQACSDCHTRAATPPMKTRLQAAFHDPKAQSGTCIDCHKKVNASGKKAPLKCTECHKKG